MEPERWERVQDLYFAALERAPPARSSFLHLACAGDPALRAEVERLVALASRAGDFLEVPPLEAIAPAFGLAWEGAGALAPGTAVGRYVIGAPLGAGGMGTVYAARDPELDRDVALKLVRPAGGSREGLLREAQALARIADPHVVAVYDAGRHGDGVFLAMELAGGGTLEDWLRTGSRTRREVLAAFLQAARGLAAAHRAGVVHRDFKPANVLRGADGTLRVADFGLARAGDRDAAAAPLPAPASPGPRPAGPPTTRAAMGTPSFMAPEQYLGGAVGPHTDQFAFAVALYEALYGAHPFPAATLAELRERVLAGRVADAPERSRVPRRLRAALLRALAVDPARRWPSMAALIAEVEAATARRRRLLAAAAGLLVAAVVAGAYLAGRSGPPSPAPPTVAVLPFAGEGSEVAVAALAEGLTDELIRALVRIEALAVPARASVFSLRDRGMAPAEIARRLGVAHLLEGSVRQEGDRFRVSVRCLAAGGEPLWSETFDRPADELFRIQEELARAIVDRFDVELAGPEPLVARSTESLEAYSFYLRGREQWNRRSEDGLRQAVSYFERSLAADDRYALAYSGLADAYSLMPGYVSRRDPEAIPKARAAARRALELAPELAETHASMASVLQIDGDFAGAEAHLRRAIEINPRYATARHWYGHLLARRLIRLQEAIEQLELARRLDPASSSIMAMLAGAYYDAGRHADALATERELRELDPHWYGGTCLSRYAIARRRFAEAIAEVEGAGPPEARTDACWRDLAEAHHLAGDYRAELAVAREGLALEPRRHHLAVAELAALAALGRTGEMEARFARGLAAGPSDPFWYFVPQVLGELRVHGQADAARRFAARFLAREAELPDVDRSSLAPALTRALVLVEGGRTAAGAADLLRTVGGASPSQRAAIGLSECERIGLQGWAWALAGRREEARRALDRLAALEAPSSLPPYAAIVLAALGERREAFSTLDARLAGGLVFARELHTHPGLEPLRGDEALLGFAARWGLPDALPP